MSKNLLNLLLIAGTFALYFLVIGPLYKGTGGIKQPEQSIQALMLLNRQYDETLVQAESLYNQAEELRGQYMGISDEQKKKMAVMVPDSIDKVRLLSEMLNVSASTSMPFSDLTYSEGGSIKNGPGTAGISFTIKTTYPKFKEFMDAIEKSMRLFSIQEVSFKTSEEGELTTYQVKLETYYMK